MGVEITSNEIDERGVTDERSYIESISAAGIRIAA
jgi:hypothetical protein